MTGSLPIGELIACFYEEFLALYGDAEQAAVATAAVINQLLAEAAADRATV